MTRINVGYLLAFGLLGTAVASPKPIAVPQSQQEIDPNPSLTYSMRDPEVTNFETQNATTTTSPDSSTAGGATASASASTPLTQIAAFTAPNGGKYTATVIDGTMQIAGYVLTVGGPEYLVGGVRVSAASGGLKHGESTAAYAKVTGQATTEVVSTSTDASGSTQVVSSSATVPVAASTSASGTRSSSGSTSASSSASASGAASTGSAAAGVTAKSRGAVLGLAGIAVLVCVFA